MFAADVLGGMESYYPHFQSQSEVTVLILVIGMPSTSFDIFISVPAGVFSYIITWLYNYLYNLSDFSRRYTGVRLEHSLAREFYDQTRRNISPPLALRNFNTKLQTE
ncbi:hypothetical protein B0H66DRAFT_530307 [Apodospora peruviana]|uniref:Uncharacterized protein n=1 Tax=Apodospora peruviana TaxID=516989 RepID=A0AAE0MCT3_9PEZI|nr:hypothetical protein B0H66DRAFT_530307 [Apodospora peruviana]